MSEISKSKRREKRLKKIEKNSEERKNHKALKQQRHTKKDQKRIARSEERQLYAVKAAEDVRATNLEKARSLCRRSGMKPETVNSMSEEAIFKMVGINNPKGKR